jgi:xanthosine phosphorylase
MPIDSPFQAAAIIHACSRDGFKPRVALILGSGLGALAEQLQNPVTIGFAALPGFPVSTVQGHAGELVLGSLAGVDVVCMKGRGHFYEGFGLDVMTCAVRTFKLLGCEQMFVTNAAGSLRQEVDAGSLVVMTDHINFLPGSPMVGANDERFGPRFFSMANAYDADLRQLLKETASASNIDLHEGVYLACSGPNFETPAEIRAFSRLGADVVGMSVVPEVVAARHCDLKVVGVSVITNLAEGLSSFPLSHEQTLKYAGVGGKSLISLILSFLGNLAKTPQIATQSNTKH